MSTDLIMTTLKITGMNCQHCVSSATRALEAVSGVTGVQVDLASGLAQVEGSAAAVALLAAVQAAGYGVELV
jgi:copper chaperone CopZ